MADQQEPDRNAPPPAKGGRFAWPGFALAIAGGAIIGLLWAWWAEMAQGYFAPLILFPLLLGAAAGLMVVGLVRVAQIGHRPTIAGSVVLAAVLAATAQHYFTYLAAYRQPADATAGRGVVSGSSQPAPVDLSAVLDRIKPSFGEYLQGQARRGRPLLLGYVARGWVVWLTWAIDGLLILAAALAVAIPAMRMPYCDRCRTWYRATRCGKTDLPTAERLAAVAGVELPERPRSPRYRLSNCQNGCGPTRCELSWEETDGGVSLFRIWLDAAQRNQMAAILDELAADNDDP